MVGKFGHERRTSLGTNEQRDAIFRLRAWLAALLGTFSAASVTSELYEHTQFTLFCYYFEERNEGLFSLKRDLSFRARPSPNRQDLDESVRNLVGKQTKELDLEIVVGLDS